MFSFKRSLIALVGLLVIVGALATLMPLISRGQGGNPLTKRPAEVLLPDANSTTMAARRFRPAPRDTTWPRCGKSLTPRTCGTTRIVGLTQADSGFGPPTNTSGWIRTGAVATRSSSPGSGNCKLGRAPAAWMKGLLLPFSQLGLCRRESSQPVEASTSSCNSHIQVWCMQD